MQRRVIACLLSVVICFSSFARPVYAAEVGIAGAAIGIVSAIAASAGVFVSGSDAEIRDAMGVFVDQSSFKKALYTTIPELQLVEAGLRYGYVLAPSFKDLLSQIYTEVASYFSSGSVLAAAGIHDMTNPDSYKAITLSLPISFYSKGDVLNEIHWICGCSLVSTYVSGSSRVDCIQKPSWAGSYETTISGGDSACYAELTKHYTSNPYWTVICSFLSSSPVCPHGNSASVPNVENVVSVYGGNEWLLLNALGWATLPMIPVANEGLIPADVWLDGWFDSLDEWTDVVVWNPPDLKPCDDMSKVWDTTSGLVSGVDIPGYVDRDLGWVCDVIPGITTGDKVEVPPVAIPDITFPDVGVLPDINVGENVETGTIAGLIAGVGTLVKGLYDAVSAIPVAIATTLVGTGTLDFSKLTKLKLISIFPFCIPFDLINLITQFDVPPVPPSFELDFRGTFLAPMGAVTLDLRYFDKAIGVVRFSSYMLFVVGLIVLTRKIIKG